MDFQILANLPVTKVANPVSQGAFPLTATAYLCMQTAGLAYSFYNTINYVTGQIMNSPFYSVVRRQTFFSQKRNLFIKLN
jgi:hypothetical protein